MATIAILVAAVQAVVLGATNNLMLVVALTATAVVPLSFAATIEAIVIAIAVTIAFAFDVALALSIAGVATAALAVVNAFAVREVCGVPLRYGVTAFGTYAVVICLGPYLVGYDWPTAGYAAMWWYLLPAFGTVAAILLLRVGESMGKYKRGVA